MESYVYDKIDRAMFAKKATTFLGIDSTSENRYYKDGTGTFKGAHY